MDTQSPGIPYTSEPTKMHCCWFLVKTIADCWFLLSLQIPWRRVLLAFDISGVQRQLCLICLQLQGSMIHVILRRYANGRAKRSCFIAIDPHETNCIWCNLSIFRQTIGVIFGHQYMPYLYLDIVENMWIYNSMFHLKRTSNGIGG